MSKTIKVIVSALMVAVVALAFGAGYTFGRHNLSGVGEGLNIVGQAWNIIFTDYVDRENINTANMTRAAIEGMVETLDDPYTSYMAADQYEWGLSNLEGEFDGIGVYVTVEDRKLVVIAPITDSPADKAGIRAGDIILEVNGELVAEMSLMEAVVKIRGPEGTAVQLLILHKDEPEPEIIEIIRTRVEVPSVRFEMKEEIAYIDIIEFTKRTEAEIGTVLQSLTEENARGIILDLRGNPGGLVDAVIGVASHFLHEGIVLNIKYTGKDVDTLYVQNTASVTDLPMVVLVDNASASGSEVLAGALQDYDRATIAGTKTFGKGSVNILRRLDDGSGLYITTGRWLTPNGNLIEGEGIQPDYQLELTGEDAVQWAVDYLTGSD